MRHEAPESPASSWRQLKLHKHLNRTRLHDHRIASFYTFWPPRFGNQHKLARDSPRLRPATTPDPGVRNQYLHAVKLGRVSVSPCFGASPPVASFLDSFRWWFLSRLTISPPSSSAKSDMTMPVSIPILIRCLVVLTFSQLSISSLVYTLPDLDRTANRSSTRVSSALIRHALLGWLVLQSHMCSLTESALRHL